MVRTASLVAGPNGALFTVVTTPVAPETQARGTILCVHATPDSDHRGCTGLFDAMADWCSGVGFRVVQFDFAGCGRSTGVPAAQSLTTQRDDLRAMVRYARADGAAPLLIATCSVGAAVTAGDWPNDIAGYVFLWPAFTPPQPSWPSPRLPVGEGLALPPVPCLLLHGRHDGVVPFTQSVEAAMHARGRCTLMLDPTAGHRMDAPESRTAVRHAVLAWLPH